MNYQARVWQWFAKCFVDDPIAPTPQERCARVVEEFAELMQAATIPLEQVISGVVDVYQRDHVGEVEQEVGGLYLTLATFCTVYCINGEQAADLELSRVNEKIPKIREKTAARRSGPTARKVSVLVTDQEINCRVLELGC